MPNLLCVQQFCAWCEEVDGDVDCLRCDKRRYWFWVDAVVELLTYLCEPRPWATKSDATEHNAQAFDLLFILNRAILLK